MQLDLLQEVKAATRDQHQRLEAILPLTIESLPEERYAAVVENAAYRLVAETAKAGATKRASASSVPVSGS